MTERANVSRRRFLGTGAGAASAVLLSSRPVRAQTESDDIRCGMIGTGGRGSRVLAAIHKSPGVRITALCDIKPDNLNKAAATVQDDKPKLFDDYHKMLDYPELDAVFVETPCFLHKPMVVDVLRSGRHCYGEKPMAINVPDLNEMVRVVKETKKVYQVGTQLRYAHPWQSAVKAIHAGVIGKPVIIRGHRYNVGDLPHDCKWLFDRKLSGDTMLEQAVHELDIFNWVFGGRPERAAGFGGQDVLFEPPGRNIMDNYTLSLEYGKGKRVCYTHMWFSAPGAPHNNRQEIVYGAKGAVDIETGKLYPRGEGKPSDVEAAAPKGNLDLLAVNNFFTCIRENKKPLTDAEAGRNGALTALLGTKAIREKRVVTMKELLAQG